MFISRGLLRNSGSFCKTTEDPSSGGWADRAGFVRFEILVSQIVKYAATGQPV